MPNCLVKVHLPIYKLNYVSESDIFEIDSKEYEERIDAILNKFKEQFKKEYNNDRISKYLKKEIAEKEFLNKISEEINFDIIYILNSVPNIEQCHNLSKEAGKLLGEEIITNIPAYGFYQQYYPNAIGVGNYKQFINLEEDN